MDDFKWLGVCPLVVYVILIQAGPNMEMLVVDFHIFLSNFTQYSVHTLYIVAYKTVKCLGTYSRLCDPDLNTVESKIFFHILDNTLYVK